ncbi:FAD-dependent tricarballylate dehydrogenase TcuA [Phytoactinopolyspora limicola]|uniref:FAD-dependent tricarballylate dehydrogenase TcuA n=1 Tax=Phytoactinopolyspora limicola TaxID=2715536 RepID=UPI00140835EF|nr:FAD-dependent tricarballylate dehydrogenase TcuA [Phytoactinopolyspora limicola]
MGRGHVIVIGGGNAGLCSALAALEGGASVTLLEVATEAERGGNSRFTAGAMRVAYDGTEAIQQLVPDLGAEQMRKTDFGSYPTDKFFDDLSRVTEHRCDPDLAELLVTRSFDTLTWMRDKGVRFLPIYGRQAFEVNGRFRFWGGLTIEANGGGEGLVGYLFDAFEKAGGQVLYGHRAVGLTESHGAVTGVVVRVNGELQTLPADAVVLAAGGFQANTEWRTRYLGAGWEFAKVRGSRFNIGDGIRMAFDIGAMSWGHWSGCHAVGMDLNAPPHGDLAIGDGYQKHSYPFGLMVNGHGRRFVDEGADFRNYTYAKYGREILYQPAQFAWQVFDSKVTGLLRDEYRIRQVTKVTADTLEDLARRMDGVDPQQFVATVHEYNDTVDQSVEFNPNIKDGRGTRGLTIPKSNWANTIDTPPYEAYGITCGITFTFGGLKIDAGARVLDTMDRPIPGLYACGELVGGIFYFNYPGGSGLTAGAVFGRIAGTSAAEDHAVTRAALAKGA